MVQGLGQAAYGGKLAAAVIGAAETQPSPCMCSPEPL